MLAKIEDFLKGRKTYGLVIVGLVLWGANQVGWIQLDASILKQFESAITLAAIAALRAGIGAK